MDTTGYNWLLIVADNDYGGLSTAAIPVACLPRSATTLQLAGGYENDILGTHYDCRISYASFSGRNAWSNGVNYASQTTWSVYGF